MNGEKDMPHTLAAINVDDDELMLSRSEKGLLDADEVISLHSIHTSDDDELSCSVYHDCDAANHPQDMMMAKQLHNMAEELHDLREKVALLETSKQTSKGESLLPEDAYSFLAISRPTTTWRRPGRSFLVALGIFAFQTLTLILLALDVVDKANTDNPLSIPGGVDIQVRISQLIALIITVISQDEVRLSLNVLYNGYDEQIVKQAFTGASRWRWYLSSVCRLVEGCLALAVTFMLLITVRTVRELLLNFTAVEFVSNVDNAMFLLSSWGYFGTSMKTDAEDVAKAEMKEVEDKRGRRFPRTLCLILIFLGMLAAWLYVAYKQANGEYLPPRLYVQFGDGFSPALGTFSGLYEINNGKGGIFFGERAEYVAATPGRYEGWAKFKYCAGNRFWVLLAKDDPSESLDVCSGSKQKLLPRDKAKVRAVSSETFTYDISDTASETWFVRDYKTDRDVPLQHFSLRTPNKVIGPASCRSNEATEDQIICVNNTVWACRKGWYGISCQFPEPCKTLEINERYRPFSDARPWSSRYDIVMKDATSATLVYGRPVYIGNQTSQEGSRDIILFTGRRWALTHTNLFDDLRNTTKSIGEFMSNSFHAYWTNFSVEFISEAVDLDTPADGPTPVSLQWFRSKAQTSQSIQAPDLNRDEEAVFLCAICDMTSNPCLFGGICVENGTRCDCVSGSKGRLCQITPEGDGRCNPDFNTPRYGYDGGDCCPRTCLNGESICGTGGDGGYMFGLPSQRYVGFPNCKDPSQLCEENACWKHLTDLKGSDDGARAGTYVVLSGNGAVVAMFEPGLGLVRVFEQAGAVWKPRGEPLRVNASSTPRTDEPWTDNQSLIALSDTGTMIALGLGGVQVYLFDATRRSWSVFYNDVGETETASVALSSDGTILATCVFSLIASDDGDTSLTTETARIYEYISGEWLQLGPEIDLTHDEPSDLSGFPCSLSLSSSGTTVAVGKYFNRSIGVYAYDSESNQWVSFGPSVSQGGAHVRYSVSLSGNGKGLAIGNPSDAVASIFVYNQTASGWTKRGMDIRGEDTSAFGTSVSLSDDAATIAVGVPYHGIGLESDRVEVYRYGSDGSNTSTWTQYGSDLNVATKDNSGVSVSLSRDGSVVAFGAPTFDRSLSGMVRVLWNTKTKAKDESHAFVQPVDVPVEQTPTADTVDSVPITFEIQLDSSPWETSLLLACVGRQTESISWGELTEANARILGTVQVPRGANCKFTIADLERDGICCSKTRNGFYRIYYGNTTDETNLLAEGGRLFGSREQASFWAEPPISLTPITVAVTLAAASSPESISVDLRCGNVLHTSAPRGTFQKSINYRQATFLLPEGTECVFRVGSHQNANVDFNIHNGRDTKLKGSKLPNSFRSDVVNFVVPTCNDCAGTKDLRCESGSSLFQFELDTDDNGGEISFDLWSDDGILLEENRTAPAYFLFPRSSFVKQICVPDDACLYFYMYNVSYYGNETCCDQGGEASYRLLLDNKLITNGSNFLAVESDQFGYCPPTPSPTVLDDCSDGEVSIRVELFTDWFPQDTLWRIWKVNDGVFDESSWILQSGGPYRSVEYRSADITNSTCVPGDACLLFVIQDLSNNGICCKFGGGTYTVYYNGTEVGAGGDFGSYETSSLFGSCPSLPTQGGTTSAAPQSVQSLLPTVTQAPSPSMSDSPIIITPTPVPTPYALPDVALALPLAPTPAPSPASCPNGTTLLRFELSTDRNPQEVSWEAITGDDNQVLLNGGPYNEFEDAFQTFVNETCIANDVCIYFYLYDSAGNGICCDYGSGSYTLSYGGSTLLETGGNASSSSATGIETRIGPCKNDEPATTPTSLPTPSPGSDCTDGFVPLRLELFTDQFPAETSFVVHDNDDEEVIWLQNDRPFDAETDAFTLFTYQTCIPEDRCYHFEISDTATDGICCQFGEGYFELKFGQVFSYNGNGNFAGGESFSFGACRERLTARL